jgi:hypothetical protein
MKIKFDKKKSNTNEWNCKRNKSNSIQLEEWGPLCNFARPTHLLRWRREKRGEEKNCRQSSFMPWMPTRAAPPCRRWCLLRTPPRKATNGNRKELHKGHGRLPLCTHQPFFIIKRPKYPWSNRILARNWC